MLRSFTLHKPDCITYSLCTWLSWAMNKIYHTCKIILYKGKGYYHLQIFWNFSMRLWFQGVLSDGAVIAVKQLSSKSRQGNREFVNEIGMISALQHPHLVKLYGCCIEGNQLLLVYEYLENNSLARALFGTCLVDHLLYIQWEYDWAVCPIPMYPCFPGREEHQLQLDWQTRRKILLGIAKGLSYLHEESRLKIVHRDIKATNVLLDKDLNAKISDFGLAKLDEEENTHISTRIAGTMWVLSLPIDLSI